MTDIGREKVRGALEIGAGGVTCVGGFVVAATLGAREAYKKFQTELTNAVLQNHIETNTDPNTYKWMGLCLGFAVTGLYIMKKGEVHYSTAEEVQLFRNDIDAFMQPDQ